MQLHAVNPLCIGQGIVNVPHKTETCAPDLGNLDCLTWLYEPVAHLQRWGNNPMSIDLIVLWHELTAVYFSLSHDTLSVVGNTYYIKDRLTCQPYYLFYKE